MPLAVCVALEKAGSLTLPVAHHPACDMVDRSRGLYS